ncbi:polyamine ABC transporter substrate-binding protein [Paraburkholderia bonniea]|uniref:polyamine ABC transporter substrate-binding protein n=1 Tax=Paraburkholderia bonniea TaxID=2152891 RepID=UPI0025745F2B|nr:polyamine ABC transporter substrate-binding protein [Paraburkholderia bonniea]WJF92070.1 polyamine ABC transporter substrate-binding protein [Paraburkholderia bonniea]WJF95390.1 polyamine ABC transporter substrate-binding protein [Paraburkholderia bonniea]
MRVRHIRLALAGAALTAASFVAWLGHPAAMAAEAQLNVYNWSDYIAYDTVSNFEQQTGLTVKYDSYDSDDTLQAKLLSGSSGYDIVVPTSSYMARQIQAGVYQKIDRAQLPNLAHLSPVLMKRLEEADPGNQYGVPWAYGTDGIGYNVEAVRKALGKSAPVDSWALVFDPANMARLKSCGVSFLDQPSDVFAAALQYLHKDPNSANPADYHAAFDMLRKVRPYITQFNSSGYINDLVNHDVCVSLAWSGDVGIARRRAQEAHLPYEIRFANVREGGLLWFDMMVIPKDAPHPQAAMKWINYILQPKVSASITNAVFYPGANHGARALIAPALAQDPSLYPADEVLSRMSLMRPVPPEVHRLMNRLWAQLKTGH